MPACEHIWNWKSVSADTGQRSGICRSTLSACGIDSYPVTNEKWVGSIAAKNNGTPPSQLWACKIQSAGRKELRRSWTATASLAKVQISHCRKLLHDFKAKLEITNPLCPRLPARIEAAILSAPSWRLATWHEELRREAEEKTRKEGEHLDWKSLEGGKLKET